MIQTTVNSSEGSARRGRAEPERLAAKRNMGNSLYSSKTLFYKSIVESGGKSKAQNGSFREEMKILQGERDRSERYPLKEERARMEIARAVGRVLFGVTVVLQAHLATYAEGKDGNR